MNYTKLNIKRKIWTWTRIRTRTSRSLAWRSTIELSWFSCQFIFKFSSWNNCHYLQFIWSMTLPAIYWSLSKLTLLLNKYDFLNQIIKCLNQIISKNTPYNFSPLYIYIIKFQEKIWTWTRTQTRISRSLAWRWRVWRRAGRRTRIAQW